MQVRLSIFESERDAQYYRGVDAVTTSTANGRLGQTTQPIGEEATDKLNAHGADDTSAVQDKEVRVRLIQYPSRRRSRTESTWVWECLVR